MKENPNQDYLRILKFLCESNEDPFSTRYISEQSGLGIDVAIVQEMMNLLIENELVFQTNRYGTINYGIRSNISPKFTDFFADSFFRLNENIKKN